MNIKTEAKVLVKESFNSEDVITIERVKAVCDFIEEQVQPEDKLKLLRQYLKEIEPILRKSEVLIESSGSLDEKSLASIKTYITNKTQRKNLTFNVVENKDILGGIRITCDDTIWEMTAKSALESVSGNS